MCTMIVEKAEIYGTGKGPQGWFGVDQVNVSYDHPFNLSLDHALSIDFVDESAGLGARVAVEISPESAVALIEALESALQRGDAELGTDFASRIARQAAT